MIAITKPFKTGDSVTANGESGSIKKCALYWKDHEQICERTECKNCKL
jgi:hypothetical protein